MTNQPPPMRAKREIVVSIMFWLCIPFMVIFPLCLFMSSLWDAQLQHQIIQSYVPVEAKVLLAEVNSFTSSKGEVHYHVRVHYEYTVSGKKYHSDNLMPLSAEFRESSANAVVARYKANPSTQAYYNPDDPSQSILIREYSRAPYVEMLQCTFIQAGGFFFLAQLWFAKRRLPERVENGWFEILPESSQRQRLLTAKVCTGIWYSYLAIAAAHFFIFVPPSHGHRELGLFELFALPGLIPLLLLFRCLQISRNLDDAHLLVERPAAILGRPFRFSISQNARRQLQLKRVQARLLCVARKDKSRRVLFEATPVDLKDHTLHVGETLQLPAEVPLPSDLRPSGRDQKREFDSINWELRLSCNAAHAPVYNVKFPLKVETPADTGPDLALDDKPHAVVDVRPVEPEFAGQILTKRNAVIGLLIVCLVLFLQLLGAAITFSAFLVLYPDKSDPTPFWNLPKPQAELMLAAGIVWTLSISVFGLAFPGLLSGSYLHSVAKRNIERRRNAIVQPGADSVYVDIIPRCNWNRVMLESAADIGFMAVDAGRREIRFEGDKERYRIPAEALLSCKLEKTYYTQTARANAPGFWLVLIRAAGPNGVWEAPVLPRLYKRRNSTKVRLKAAEDLLNKIKALSPAADLAGQ